MTNSERRPDVDALRVFATFLLFPFHVGKVYDLPPFYHVKNAELSTGLGYFTGFVHQWHMPLFFLLAGWSLFGSLETRSVRDFLRERAARLLVPLAFGLLAIGPLLRWAELRTGQFTTLGGAFLPAEPRLGFLDYLPRYFAHGDFTWGHLWFLAYLFTFSLLYLPLFLRLRGRAREERPVPAWAVYAPILPLALVQVTLRPHWPGFQNLVDDWANFAYYSLFLFAGFALAKRPAFERAALAQWRTAGGTALAALVVMGLGVGGALPLSAAARNALSAIAGWCGVLFWLGAARRVVRAEGPGLRALAAASMPIYVLHQPAVVLVALGVIALPLGIPAKFALTLGGALVLALGVYAFVVRPLPPLRFVLGMKGGALRRVAAPANPRAAAALGAVLAGVLSLSGCDRAASAPLRGAASDWPAYGRDAGGSRYSPLDEITPANVKRLEIAWVHHTGETEEGRRVPWRNATFEATPILADGTLFLCTMSGRVLALDPETGAERWTFDTGIDRSAKRSDPACRGVSTHLDAAAPDTAACRRRILVGTLDARLLALDAVTGRPCEGFGDRGSVHLDRGVGRVREGQYLVTSPPAVIGDAAVVGSAIGDNWGADDTRGVVRAFDARTGALRWSFDPIPHDPADPASAGWRDGSAARTGGANAWAILSADPERGLVFVPTGSASPDFYGGERRGDNRYADSVVALRAATGEVAWSFQAVHHDLWDYDVPAQPTLVTLKRDGREIAAVAQATKMGHLFLLDRETGAPLFPVEERPVPASDVPGEEAWPTQPFPTRPAPLVPQGLSPDDAWGLTPWDRGRCRERIASLRSDGIFTPPSTRGTIIFPGNAGGTDWGGVAVDPVRGLLLVNTTRVASVVTLIPREGLEAARAAHPGVEISPMYGTPFGMMREVLLSPLGIPCNAPPWGTLAAVDLATGGLRWQSTLGTTRDLAPVPIALPWGTPNMGGPIVTAGGLVFIGAAMDDYLRAFDVETGEELWKGRLPAGGQATPMTYRVRDGGRQYVVIAAGGHGRLGTRLGDAVVAFALGD